MKTTFTAAALACAATACTDSSPTPVAPQAAPQAVVQQQAPIVMGRLAGQGEILSTVALVGPDGHFFCTGTLIAPTVVVSAAHCFMNEAEDGWIGPDDLQIGIDSLDATPVPRAKRVAVERFTLHPDYVGDGGDDRRADGLGQDNDLAIVILAAPADQRPTPVLPAGMLGQLRAMTPLTISGFGITDLNEARDRSGQLHIGETPYLERSAHELIAGGQGLTDTCNGDSGGPAYVTLGGQRYLLGATSRAAHDADAMCGDRGIYTLVPAYQDWIDAIVAGDPAALTPPPALDGAGGGWDEEGEWEEGEWEEGEWEEGECLADDGEPGADVCAEEGWYGDGECDVFCDRPDPDCAGVPAEDFGCEDGEEGEAAPEPEAEEGEAPDADEGDDDADDADDDAGEVDADDDGPIALPAEEAPENPHIDGLRDELGCTTAVGSAGSAWWMALPLLGFVAARRRRRHG